MSKINRHYSRAFWEKYIDSIIHSINEDKDTIIDMLVYGDLNKAHITMNLSMDSVPSYQIEVDKNAIKSPFGEENDE